MSLDFKVSATLGPASAGPATLARLLGSVDRFRLNGSHLAPAELREWLARLAELFSLQGRTVPVVLDLQGAKMRIGEIPSVESLPEQVSLRRGEASDSAGEIPVPHAELFESVEVGDTLTLDDGRVVLVVIARSPDGLRARVVRNGPLASRKGINRADHPVALGGLVPRDLALVAASRDFEFVELAFSFVHTGAEARWLRPVAGGRRLIGKVERPEAFAHLREIDAAFDETWLCRGDLEAQAGPERLGPLHEAFEESMRSSFRQPAHLAGQVLEHLTQHPEPTRSEVVHLHKVRQAGWAGIVLSDETAVGRHPEVVADWIDRLCRA